MTTTDSRNHFPGCAAQSTFYAELMRSVEVGPASKPRAGAVTMLEGVWLSAVQGVTP